ncbi:MAG: RnfABCDGE type electron transport complex subunit D [Candidatus Omnitrophica bacterium]|nr:RnfABCDGE type electron transport complex subunit D [Candidatus Omnitrophota bacterium]
MIRKLLDFGYKLLEKNKKLEKFKPVLNAVDGFFFGTAKTTISSPHCVDCIDIKRFMVTVIIALIPSLLSAVYFYGLRVIFLIIISYIFGGLSEVVFAIIRKREIEEGFLVTGLIFPLTLPPTVPWWVVAIGIIFGVIFGKEVFGGTGRNIFNPALVGRIFVTISFPKIMTISWYKPLVKGIAGFGKWKPDAITSATPLMLYKSEKTLTSLKELLFGFAPGCLGETFKIGIMIGGIFLVFTKVANWRIPLTYLLSVFFFSYFGHIFSPDKFAPPTFQLLTGGLLFGAFFMATDPVTSPFTNQGKFIVGIMLGFLTVIIRVFSGYVEGVMFAILLVNGFTPLIDYLVVERKYGRKYKIIKY